MKAEWNDPGHNHTVCPNCNNRLSSDDILWDWDAETQAPSDYFGVCPHCAIYLDFSQDRHSEESEEELKKLVRRTRDALNKCKNWGTVRDVARRLGVIS